MQQLTKQQQIAQFLDRHATDLPRSPYWYPDHRSPWEARPPVEEIARNLLQIVEFHALQLGRLLGTVDGQVILQGVEMVSPPFYAEDIALIAEALQLAATAQTRQMRQAALTTAAVGAGVGSILFWIDRRAA